MFIFDFFAPDDGGDNNNELLYQNLRKQLELANQEKEAALNMNMESMKILDE